MRVGTSGLALLLMIAACGDDGTTPPTGGTGAGAGGLPAAGIGGAGSGSGGAGGAVAGVGAGSGGATAGSGGVAAGAGGGGASGAAGGMGGAGGRGMPGAPTFTAIFDEIIAGTGCNGGPTCHSGTIAGMLLMTNKDQAYMNLVMKPAAGVNIPPNMAIPNCKDVSMMRVVPGQPDMSLLVKKVEMLMPPCGGPMPPGMTLLPMAQQQQIRQWIMMGAMNN